MATVNILSEQVNRIYSRYLDKDNEKLDIREVRLMVVQVINSLFKVEKAARMDVVGASIATYEETRKESGGVYYVDLPVSPISLPKEQGIHRVFQKNCPWRPYVPIRSGDFDIVQGTPMEFIEGQTGYYLDGMRIVFTKKVPEDIVLKLVVYDPSENYDAPVPVPKDMEPQVIQGVLQMLGMGQVAQAELNAKHEQVINNERNRS